MSNLGQTRDLSKFDDGSGNDVTAIGLDLVAAAARTAIGVSALTANTTVNFTSGMTAAAVARA